MEFFRSRNQQGVAVFLTSVLVILLFWAVLPKQFAVNEGSDYFYYYEPIARSLLRGDGITINGIFADRHPPGYAVLLSGVFWLASLLHLPEGFVYASFTLLCAGMATVFIFLLAESIWGAAGGWAAALFFTTYPFFLWLTKQPSTEIPFIAFFYATIYVFWLGLEARHNPHRMFFLAGVLAGVTMLIRSAGFGMGIVMAALIFALKKQTRAGQKVMLAALLLAGNLLAIAPWEAQLYIQTGQVILLGTNGPPSVRDGLTFGVNPKGYRVQFDLPADVLALQQKFLAEKDEPLSAGALAQSIWTHLKHEPVAMLRLLVIKTGRSWYGTDSGQSERAIIAIQLLYGIFLLYATHAAWQKHGMTGALLTVTYVFVFYFWGLTMLVLSILRYTTPVIGLLALLVPGVLPQKKSPQQHE